MQYLDLELKQARNRKAPEIDGINMELWKYGSRILKILLQLVDDIWSTRRIPEAWNTAQEKQQKCMQQL